MPLGYINFEFDLPEALLARLIDVLDSMDSAPLVPGSLRQIPEEQGVYQLFMDERLVYIGKTDAEAGLRKRLDRHCSKTQHRIGLQPKQVSFKAVRIYVFTAMDLEAQLITHYGGLANVWWNGSGFGSNDPGRNRDTSRYKENHFDAIFPIDIDRPLNIQLPKPADAATILKTLKGHLPYVLRFQGASPRSRKPHPDLVTTLISVNTPRTVNARQLIETTVGQLPPGWQATKLPSHIILYKEKRTYPQGEIIGRSTA